MASGCASVSKAPSEKSEAAKSFSAPDDRGSVFLYRTGRAVGAAGQVCYIRQDARLGLDSGRVSMKEVDSKKGMNEVQGCKLFVTTYIPE